MLPPSGDIEGQKIIWPTLVLNAPKPRGNNWIGQAVSDKNERPTEACFVLLSRKTTGDPYVKPETLGSLVIQAKGTDIRDEGHQLGAVSKGTVYQTLLPGFRGSVTIRRQRSFAPTETHSCSSRFLFLKTGSWKILQLGWKNPKWHKVKSSMS